MGEEAAEGREAQLFLAAHERPEAGLEAFPSICVPVPGCPAHRPLAQASQRVAFGITSSRLLGSAGRMQQSAIFGCEEEDQAIDDPQKLLEIGMSAECTLAQR